MEEEKNAPWGNDRSMRTLLSLLLLIFLTVSPASPEGMQGTDEIPIFNNRFKIEAYGNTVSPRFVFISPHYNEQIGAEAARRLVESWKDPGEAVLYRVRPCNSGVEEAMKRDSVLWNDPPGRYLYFSFENRWYCIDPNRIFTERGIEQQIILWKDGNWVTRKDAKKGITVPAAVLDEVEGATGKLLISTGIEGKKGHPEAVVAVHNNSPTAGGSLETFSFLWYMKGGPCFNEIEGADGTSCIYEGDREHIDNLFLVNRREDFEYIRRDGRFNVALFKSHLGEPDSDDGSLAAYCGRRGLRYINIEVQHMNKAQEVNGKNGEYQYAMLQLLRKMLKEEKGSNKR